jgi:hypothetical protein
MRRQALAGELRGLGVAKQKPRVVGGVFEVGVGVPDAAEALAYWECFGYRAGPRGTLSAVQAKALYHVDSGLESIRLLHQDADHGLVRLMVWDEPTGPGLGMAPLRTPGNRWAVAKTRDVMAVANHARALQDRGDPIALTELIFRVTGAGEPKPFREPFACKREVMMFLPHSRHVLVQRYEHDLPNFGNYDDDSFFHGSQFTQVGLCYAGEEGTALDFYDSVLGLKRSGERRVVAEEGGIVARMLPMEAGEELIETDFDDVRWGPAPDEQLSGKLRIFRVPAARPEEDIVAQSGPGNLGFSLYTLRTHDIEGLHDRVAASGATGLTEIIPDEFGQPAFSFAAPDKYVWTVLAA